MGRFLLGTWPFVGCVYPFIALAEALRARGHEVAFYSGARAEPLIAPEGFELFPFRAVPEDRVWAAIVAAERGATSMWRKPALAYRTLRDWLAGTVEQQVSDLLDIVDDWRPDVIVTEPSMWGANLVLRESLGLPVALFSSLIGCLIPSTETPPWGPGLEPPRSAMSRLLVRALVAAVEASGRPLRQRMDRVRAHHGLPPAGMSLNAILGQASLYLIPSSREIDYNRHDVPPNVHYVGACIWNQSSNAESPRWLDELPRSRPWVHVTEGSLHYQDPFVLRAAVKGLARSEYEVILTTGKHRQPEALGLGPAAPNIHVGQWASHADLLPRCDVLVTTGGAGTVMAALQAGVPMVVVPTHWDKPDNAQRLVEAGAAVRLNPAECTPRRLRLAVERVLANAGYRENAQRMARVLDRYPGPTGAAGLLESLLAGAREEKTKSRIAVRQ